jgi:hypothetical protein
MWPNFGIGVLVMLLTSGCGGSGSSASPDGTVAGFARALDQHRYEDAYGLMSRTYRRRVPLEDFVQHLEEHPEEAREAATALGRPDGPAEQTAVMRFSDGDRVELRRDRGGGWRITTNLVDFYDQSSPRAALRSFVRAMERKRYDVVLRMVPDADSEGMTIERMQEAWTGEGQEEIERLLENLRANLDAPIEQVGDRATMPYGDRFTAQLVREDGVWKIEDPD